MQYLAQLHPLYTGRPEKPEPTTKLQIDFLEAEKLSEMQTKKTGVVNLALYWWALCVLVNCCDYDQTVSRIKASQLQWAKSCAAGETPLAASQNDNGSQLIFNPGDRYIHFITYHGCVDRFFLSQSS